jgi:hypothetical protein
MTKQQEKKKIESINKYFDKVVSSKEAARKFLVSLGTNDSTGKLRKHYDK